MLYGNCMEYPRKAFCFVVFVIFLVAVVAISVLFSDLHLDWLNLKMKLFWRSFNAVFFYSVPFVVTNKKIYAPWLIHYINNLYVYG